MYHIFVNSLAEKLLTNYIKKQYILLKILED